jgi:radical SAM protein with 4Fe4S-binding SPASM domain
MALRDQAGILCDGTVIPCCLDRNGKINLGNILSEMSWDEIMNSPRAKNLYEGFSQRKAGEELCRHCSYRKRFG